eukprot:m.87652 g.87652  ORF g.87652 m.87652 type:complete len:245 (+) comp11575_c0_seq2:60-794(+)
MTRQRGALATALATAAAVLSVGTCDGGHSGDTTALVLDDVEVYHTLTADESMQDQEVRFCVCTRVAAGSRNLPLERPESDDFPPPAVQVDLLPLSGDPDLFIAVGSELEDFPSSVKHQFSATTYGPDRLLIPAHVSGRILITVTSRWPSNTTFAIKARTATSLKGVEELAWNMDALDPSAYSRGYREEVRMFQAGCLSHEEHSEWGASDVPNFEPEGDDDEAADVDFQLGEFLLLVLEFVVRAL